MRFIILDELQAPYRCDYANYQLPDKAIKHYNHKSYILPREVKAMVILRIISC